MLEQDKLPDGQGIVSRVGFLREIFDPAKSSNLPELLLNALKKQCKCYRKGLKGCQRKFSESNVHEFRVAVRRLLSMLELISPLLSAKSVDKGRRVLKSHLDVFDDLRDTHVQLLVAAKLKNRWHAMAAFEKYLVKREKRFTRKTRKNVRGIHADCVRNLFSAWRKEMEIVCEKVPPEDTLSRMQKGLERAFAETERLKRKIDPGDTTTIHKMRVAFKRFRYMVEILASLSSRAPKRLPIDLHAYQTRMGVIQDAEMLLHVYDKLLRKGKAGVVNDSKKLRSELVRRRDALVREFLQNSDKLYSFRPARVNSSPNQRKGPMFQADSELRPGPVSHSISGLSSSGL